MAEDEEVEGIALGLGLDLSGFSAGIAKAKAELQGLQRSAGITIGVGVATGAGRGRGGAPVGGLAQTPLVGVRPQFSVSGRSVRDLRVDINQQLRAAALQGEAVSVPIKVGRVSYAQIREQIATGIGEVPVKVVLSTGGINKSDLAALISTQTTQSMGSVSASIRSARASRGLTPRAMGGPAFAGSGYVVGEHGKEYFEPKVTGTITPAARGAPVRSIAARLSKQESDYASNLRAAAKALHPEHIMFGRAWYPNAGRYIHQQAETYGVPENVVRGTLAALNLATSWSASKTKLTKVLKAKAAGEPFPYPLNFRAHALAEKILYHGEDPDRALGHMTKIGPFYRNLGGNLDDLTLDRWAYRSATQGAISKMGRGPVRQAIDHAYRTVAKEMGLHPREFQAAVWALEKQNSPHIQGRGGSLGGHADIQKYMAMGGYIALLRGGRAAPLPPGASMPPELGTAPLREGYVRGFHMTKPSPGRTAKENLDAIRARGLKLGSARGHTYGEPDMNWFSGDPKGYEEAYAVEAHLPQRWFEGMRHHRWQDPPTIGGPSSNMAVGRDISRRRIASWNEPWMRHYRYMQEMVGRAGGTHHPKPYTPGGIMLEYGPMMQRFRAENAVRASQTMLPWGDETKGYDQFVADSWRARHRALGGRVGSAYIYKKTIEQGGGTFNRLTGEEPHRGYAVGMMEGSAAIVPAENKRRFRGAITKVSKMNAPFVGTWLNEDQIHVDPVAVYRRKKDAAAKARELHQLAFYDLKKGEDVTKFAAGGYVSWPWRMAAGGLAELPFASQLIGDAGISKMMLKDARKLAKTRPMSFEEFSKRPGSLPYTEFWNLDPAEAVTKLQKMVTYAKSGLYKEKPEEQAKLADRMANLLAFNWPQERLRSEGGHVAGSRTIMDVEKDVRGHFPRAQVYLQGLNLERAEELHDSVAKLSKLYPRTSSQLAAVASLPEQQWGYETQWRPGGIAFTSTGPMAPPKIMMNQHDINAPDFAEKVEKMAREGHFNPGAGKGLSQIFTHEFGHALDIWGTKSELSTRAVMGKFGPPRSMYGATGPEEHVAELFAEAHGAGIDPKKTGFSGDLPKVGTEVMPGITVGELEEIPYAKPGQARRAFLSALGRIQREEQRSPAGVKSLVNEQLAMHLARRAGGGQSPHGLYMVGEIGRELFVPKRMEHMIPGRVMAQLPKRDKGGMAEIEPGAHLWQAPEDGWIVPNRLMNQVPRAQGGLQIEGPPGLATSLTGNIATTARRILENEKHAQAEAERLMQGANEARRLQAQIRSASARAALVPETYAPAHEFRAASAEVQTGRAAVRGLSPRAAIEGLAGYIFGGGRERSEAFAQAKILQQQYASFSAKLKGRDPIEFFGEEVERNRILVQRAGETWGENSKQVKVADASLRSSQSTLAHVTDLREREQAALRKAEAGVPGAIRNFAALQGTFAAYQLGLEATNLAISAAADAARPLTDEFLGFGSTATRVTAQLGTAAREMGGNVTAAIAQSAGRAGLGSEGYSAAQGALSLPATAKAGAAAAGEASDIRRAILGTQLGNAPSGLFSGFGGVLGTPFLGQQLGGGKGYTETLAGDVEAFRKKQAAAAALIPTPANPNTYPVPAPNIRGIAGGGLVDDLLNASGGVGERAPTAAETARDTKQAQLSLQALTTTAHDTNEAQQRGTTYLGQFNNGLKLVTREELALQGIDFDKLKQQFQDAGAAAGDKANADKFAENGVLLFSQATGQAVDSAEKYKKFFAQAAQGQIIPTGESFVAQQKLGLEAGRQVSAVQAQQAIGVTIPGQIGGQLLASPFGSVFAGIPGLSKASKGYITDLQGIDKQQKQLIADARAAVEVQAQFIDQNAGTTEGGQFRKYMTEVADYGTQIAAINDEIANAQAAVSFKQYSNNLRVLNRQIADARGLAGFSGGSQLGQNQRQEYLLGRIAQQLQFTLQQRQINFSTSVAGFQAPGITGQERAARKREAEIEASYAQRQLNIAERIFSLQGTSFRLSSRFAVQDLQAQRGIIKATFSLEQDQIKAQKRLNIINARQAQAQARAAALFGQATANFDSQLNVAAQYVANYGGTLAAALAYIRAAMGLPTGLSTDNSRGGGTKNRSQPTASGVIGYTSGTTELTVGEAGKEHVAIIRNPKRETLPTGPLAGGGGGIINLGGIHINVQGGGANGAEVERVARQAADIAIDRIGRQARMLGLRVA